MHILVSKGYAEMRETFTVYLGRSLNPHFKPGDDNETAFITAPNTTVVVFFNEVPVARAPPVLARPPPVSTAEVPQSPEEPKTAKWAPSRGGAGGAAAKKRKLAAAPPPVVSDSEEGSDSDDSDDSDSDDEDDSDSDDEDDEEEA